MLGFRREPGGTDYGDYVLLNDEGGAEIHLTVAAEDWLVPGKSPFGIYLYADNVEELAARLDGKWKLLHQPRLQPWDMFEFAVSDPDSTWYESGAESTDVASFKKVQAAWPFPRPRRFLHLVADQFEDPAFLLAANARYRPVWHGGIVVGRPPQVPARPRIDVPDVRSRVVDARQREVLMDQTEVRRVQRRDG